MTREEIALARRHPLPPAIDCVMLDPLGRHAEAPAYPLEGKEALTLESCHSAGKDELVELLDPVMMAHEAFLS